MNVSNAPVKLETKCTNLTGAGPQRLSIYDPPQYPRSEGFGWRTEIENR